GLPGGERRLRCLDRAPRLLGAHPGDRAELLARARIGDVYRRTGVGVAPAAVDVALLLQEVGKVHGLAPLLPQPRFRPLRSAGSKRRRGAGLGTAFPMGPVVLYAFDDPARLRDGPARKVAAPGLCAAVRIQEIPMSTAQGAYAVDPEIEALVARARVAQAQ